MEIPDRRIEFGWPGDGGLGARLVQQIIAGEKTATCGFRAAYTAEELAEVADGVGQLHAAGACGAPPRCIIRVTEAFETPFGSPDLRLVRGEGDGDDVAKFQADHRIAWKADMGESPLRDSEPLVVQLFEMVRELV